MNRELNLREKSYIVSLLEEYKAEKEYQDRAKLKQLRLQEESVWSWQRYTLPGSPNPSALDIRLYEQGLLDEYTENTWRKLTDLHLVEIKVLTKNYKGIAIGGPWSCVKLTEAGQEIAGELSRDMTLTIGTLRRVTWQALAQLVSSPEGLVDVGDGDYGGFNWNEVWLSLEMLRYVEFQGADHVFPTEKGKDFYKRMYEAHCRLYPDVEALRL